MDIKLFENKKKDHVYTVKAEYIWCDAFGKLRSKNRIIEDVPLVSINNKYVHRITFPVWNFDGSSTGQAVREKSEVTLVPVATFVDPFYTREHTVYNTSYLVLCECFDSEGKAISTRSAAREVFETDVVKESHPWFGIEQEYFLYDMSTRLPCGMSPDGHNEPQGNYYCGVGSRHIFGRKIVDTHLELCMRAGVKICGTNAEVAIGQWEFQIGPCEGINAGDHLTIARYILHRLCEEHGVYAVLDPKPLTGDWNGSGCHTNYSTAKMREPDGIKYIYEAIEKLSSAHAAHLAVYGDNSKRLTGEHETSSPTVFTSGVADRSASVRIPMQVAKAKCGYFEDRRPASDCDPYLVTSAIARTTQQLF